MIVSGLLRVVGARWIGTIVGVFLSWASVRYGIVFDEQATAKVIADVVAVMTFIFGLIYPLVHKAGDRIWNKADVASGKLAVKENEAAHQRGI